MTARDAAEELVERGFDRDQAQAMVTGYLDATSQKVGCSVHQWGLDSTDLDHILARHDEQPDHWPDEDGDDDEFDPGRLYAIPEPADTDDDIDGDADGGAS